MNIVASYKHKKVSVPDVSRKEIRHTLCVFNSPSGSERREQIESLRRCEEHRAGHVSGATDFPGETHGHTEETEQPDQLI